MITAEEIAALNEALLNMPYSGLVGFELASPGDTPAQAMAKYQRNMEALAGVLRAVGEQHRNDFKRLQRYRAATLAARQAWQELTQSEFV